MSQFAINSNITSLIAQNAFNKNTTALERTMKQLSTGLKINSAKDDPAGLTISERLNLQIRGNTQVIENIQIGMNVLNITEGNLTSITDDLMRIRDLCVQGANSFYSTDSNNAILKEIESRLANIDRLAKSTNFNGIKLLDGTNKSMLIQIGYGSDVDTNTLNIADVLQNCQTSAGGLDIKLQDAHLEYNKLTSEDFAQYMKKIDTALNKVTTSTSNAGAKYNRLNVTYQNLGVLTDNQTEAKSTLLDDDIAKSSSDMVKYQILQQSSAAILTQANELPASILKLLQ